MGLFDTNPIGGSTVNRNPQLYTPINFQNLGTGSTTSTTITPPASSATNEAKNDGSGLNALLGLASQAVQIGGAVKYQRQQSGASGRRQSLIAQCGRAPLFGRDRKDEYRKCKADYQSGLTTPPIDNTGGDVNKNLGDGGQGGSMKFVWIGLAVVAIGGIGYMLYKKS
jgi:hypothetical protein